MDNPEPRLRTLGASGILAFLQAQEVPVDPPRVCPACGGLLSLAPGVDQGLRFTCPLCRPERQDADADR